MYVCGVTFGGYLTKILSFKTGNLLKLNASTTTRLTTRCSGDLMGDQMAPGDQMGNQIFDMTKM